MGGESQFCAIVCLHRIEREGSGEIDKRRPYSQLHVEMAGCITEDDAAGCRTSDRSTPITVWYAPSPDDESAPAEHL